MFFYYFFYFFIHIFMKKLDLHEFEIIGTEIGYPFYVYDDGSYGKKRKKAGAHTIMVIRGGVSPAKALIDDELPAKQHTDPEPVRVVLHNCLEKAEKASSANKVLQNHSCPASYKEAIALRHARQMLRTKGSSVDVESLTLICKCASSVSIRKYVFSNIVFTDKQIEAWRYLMARNDIPELTSFVKRHLAEHGNDVVLCESLILFANEEIVSWFVQQKKIVHFCDELEIALLRRCFANKNFYLLERYLKCCGMYPKYRLNPKPQRVLVEEAIHNKEVLGWFKSYFVKDALL